MLIGRLGQYYFKISWVMLSLALLGVVIFTSLGFWQLHRANEKQRLISLHDSQRNKKPHDWNTAQAFPTQYEKIKLQGTYHPSLFLLDNQYHHHIWGYHMLSPMHLNQHTVVMVDRGWARGDPLREQFPHPMTPFNKQTIEGEVYYPSHNRWLTQASAEKVTDAAWVIPQFQAHQIEKILQMKVLPFIIRLSPQSLYGGERDWKIVALTPRRHQAYAFQWFSLAVLVGLVYIMLSFKKRNYALT